MNFPYKTIIKRINKYDHVILAISGGVDSMFLLDLYKSKFKGKFTVCHFNHKLREASEVEEQYLRDYCEEHAIDLRVGYGVDLDGPNMEHNASLQRWTFFEEVAREINTNIIVTAHHLNDKIENFLVQMMRGVPVDSLVMSEETEKNGFIRLKPFLDVEKDIIKYHSNRLNLTWFEDESNLDTHHDRNFIRNIILPAMQERRNVTKTIPATLQSIEKILNK